MRWYTETVRWVASQGTVGGYGNGTFWSNDPHHPWTTGGYAPAVLSSPTRSCISTIQMKTDGTPTASGIKGWSYQVIHNTRYMGGPDWGIGFKNWASSVLDSGFILDTEFL